MYWTKPSKQKGVNLEGLGGRNCGFSDTDLERDWKCGDYFLGLNVFVISRDWWCWKISCFEKASTSQTITLEIESADSLKRQIQEKEGIFPERHDVFFASRQLDDGHTMADEKESAIQIQIEKESAIQIKPRHAVRLES